MVHNHTTHKSKSPTYRSWASFTFPPLNLWNMPKHSEIVRLLNEYYYEHYKHLWEEGHNPFKEEVK